MTVVESINKAVSQGDVKGIRIMMKNSLLVDPTFNEFAEMEKLTRSVSGLYDEHDEGELKEDKSAWNDDYMNELMVRVVRNFSHERIKHLKEVVRYLRPAAVRSSQTVSAGRIPPSTTSQPRKLSHQEQRRQDERAGIIVSTRGAKIATGVVVGSVVGGAIAGAVSASVIVGAAAGAVVVGAVVAVTTNEE
jgi:hypothetical protein